jgi:hypothetical protein
MARTPGWPCSRGSDLGEPRHDGLIVNALHGAGIVVTHDGGRTNGRSRLDAIEFQSDASSVTRVIEHLMAETSWTMAATLPTGASAISFLDPRRWIGRVGSEVVRTADDGQTWVRSPAVGPPGAPESFLMTDARGRSSGPGDGWLRGSDMRGSGELRAARRHDLSLPTDGRGDRGRSARPARLQWDHRPAFARCPGNRTRPPASAGGFVLALARPGR